MTVVATNTCPVHRIYTVHQGTGIISFVQQDLKKEKFTFLWFVFILVFGGRMNFIVITLLCHSNLGVLSKNHWKFIVIDNAMLCTLLGGCHSTLDALKCL